VTTVDRAIRAAWSLPMSRAAGWPGTITCSPPGGRPEVGDAELIG
jgi:hypothetical protein